MYKCTKLGVEIIDMYFALYEFSSSSNISINVSKFRFYLKYEYIKIWIVNIWIQK
jgi:hypothetical protein